MTTNNLTELWKKGELKAGYYYVKNEFGNIFPTDYSEEYDSINDVVVKDFWTEVSDIKEVIAEVPDYLIWKNYVNGYCEEHEYNLQLIEENQKLKELLKECKDFIDVVQMIDGNKYELLTKINEVLK